MSHMDSSDLLVAQAVSRSWRLLADDQGVPRADRVVPQAAHALTHSSSALSSPLAKPLPTRERCLPHVTPARVVRGPLSGLLAATKQRSLGIVKQRRPDRCRRRDARIALTLGRCVCCGDVTRCCCCCCHLVRRRLATEWPEIQPTSAQPWHRDPSAPPSSPASQRHIIAARHIVVFPPLSATTDPTSDSGRISHPIGRACDRTSPRLTQLQAPLPRLAYTPPAPCLSRPSSFVLASLFKLVASGRRLARPPGQHILRRAAWRFGAHRWQRPDRPVVGPDRGRREGRLRSSGRTRRLRLDAVRAGRINTGRQRRQ